MREITIEDRLIENRAMEYIWGQLEEIARLIGMEAGDGEKEIFEKAQRYRESIEAGARAGQ